MRKSRPPSCLLYTSDSPVSVAIKQISDTPTPLRQLNAAVPEALEAITNRAMAKDPRDRYPSARAMLADLEEFKRNPVSYTHLCAGARD